VRGKDKGSMLNKYFKDSIHIQCYEVSRRVEFTTLLGTVARLNYVWIRLYALESLSLDGNFL